jgi:tetratricopeptide (TPR) repeat protein
LIPVGLFHGSRPLAAGFFLSQRIGAGCFASFLDTFCVYLGRAAGLFTFGRLVLTNAPPTFGHLLAEGMRLKSMDYRTLAKLVGVSHGYLWQMVNADKRAVNDPGVKRKRPSAAVVRQLAQVLDIDERTMLDAAGHREVDAVSVLAGPNRYSQYPTTAQQLYQDGVAAVGKGHSDRAVALLAAAIKKGGVSFVNAHAGLGMAHFQAERYSAAISEFSAALQALTEQPEDGIEWADLHYNRGLAYQRLARSLAGADQACHRRAAGADFRAAIALEGSSQDLYHSALCYLCLEMGRPRRVLTFGRAFLHRQTVGAVRHTTAALDIHLFMAYAYHALEKSALAPLTGGHAMELVDLSLQLCPTYWFAHYVKSTLLAQRAPQAGRLRSACLKAGLLHVKRALVLHPASREHYQAELSGDFQAWADQPEFTSLLAEKHL